MRRISLLSNLHIVVKIRVFMKSIHKKKFQQKRRENSLHTPRFMSVFVTFLAEGEKHAIFTYQKFKVFALAQSNREMR